jgi:hypothetical protein
MSIQIIEVVGAYLTDVLLLANSDVLMGKMLSNMFGLAFEAGSAAQQCQTPYISLDALK